MKDVSILSTRAWVSPHADVGEGTIIQAGAIIEEGCKIGKNSRIGYHAVLRRETIIGDNSIFGTHCVSEGYNKIGDYTTIHSQCHITQNAEIGDWIFIAPFFCGANTRKIVHGRNYELIKNGYKIKFGARIGACVDVAPGVIVGREALVDMGSLVTKDVDDFTHVRGRPAKFLRMVPADEYLKI